jgi:hypothetical protein
MARSCQQQRKAIRSWREHRSIAEAIEIEAVSMFLAARVEFALRVRAISTENAFGAPGY